MTLRRRSFRIARHGVLRAASVALILAASLVGILRISLPWLAQQPELVASMLSEALKTSVRLDRADARWASSGPILTLHGLEVGDPIEGETLGIARAEVQVDLLGGILPGRRWVRELVVDGLSFELARSAGRWSVSGLHLPPAGSDSAAKRLALLERLGAVRLRQVEISIRDQSSGFELKPPSGDLLLVRRAGRLQIGARLGGADIGTLDLVLNPDADLSSGSAYLAATDLDLSRWRQSFSGSPIEPRAGRVNSQLWVDWAQSLPIRLDGSLSLSGVAVGGGEPLTLKDVGAVDALAALPDGELQIQLRTAEDGRRSGGLWWQHAENDSAELLASGHWLESGITDVYLEGVGLEPLADLLTVIDRVPPKARSALYSMDPRGIVDRLHWHRPARSGWWLEAELSQVGYSSDPNRWPGADGLSFRLLADGDGVWLTSRPAELSVEWREAWPDAIDIKDLSFDLSVTRAEPGWEMQFERAQVHYVGADAVARGNLQLRPGELPVLQIEAHAKGPIAPSKQFWVATRMKPKTIAWLERALDNGRLRGASMYYRGPPKRWPFAGKEGRFELDIDADQIDLDYHPDWPAAKQLAAKARLVNRGLYIDQAEGTVMGVAARASGGIANFRQPKLHLDIEGGGDAADLLAFLKASPLQHSRGSLFIGMEANGPVEGSAVLDLPLRKDQGSRALTGQLALKGVNFTDAKWTVRLDDVRGDASFSLQGFSASDLSIQVGAERARLNLALGPDTGDPERVFSASLDGNVDASAMFADYLALGPIIRQFRGNSRWRGALHTLRSGKTELSYSSDLVGTQIDLPAPLAKAAQTPQALRLTGSFSDQGPPRFDLRLGDEVSLATQLASPDGPFMSNLRFGGEAAELAQRPGLSIDGNAATVDIGGWAVWIGQRVTAGVGEFEFAGMELQTENLALMGGLVPAQSISLRQNDRGWQAEVTGEQLVGDITLDQDRDGLAIVANFQRMHLPGGSGGGTGPSTQAINPRWLPAMHLYVEDFAMGDARLGEVRVEAYSTPDGLRFDQLQARSEHLDLVGSGNWRVSPQGDSSSEFDLRFTAEELGKMLVALGFSAPVEGGQTLAGIKARWAGSPLDFGLERLEGTLEVSVGSGRLIEVQPGAGRVFGLFSIRDLPRRLSLDFSDVFETGFSFNSINGMFQLSEGNAWTQDLKLEGPAADIEIVGRTGLAVRDYDQEIMVAPRVGGAIPVVGALAGGPVGAAAGLLVQGVVGRNLDGINRYRYSVMGTWENPRVVRDDRELPSEAGDG